MKIAYEIEERTSGSKNENFWSDMLGAGTYHIGRWSHLVSFFSTLISSGIGGGDPKRSSPLLLLSLIGLAASGSSRSGADSPLLSTFCEAFFVAASFEGTALLLFVGLPSLDLLIFSEALAPRGDIGLNPLWPLPKAALRSFRKFVLENVGLRLLKPAGLAD